MPMTQERRRQIFDDAAPAGLDLDGDRHPQREADGLVLDLHLRAVERDARGIDQFLSLRLAGVG